MHTSDLSLLEALLDSWDRNNTIVVNLLHAIAHDELDVRAMPDSPSVGELFGHIHYVRLVLVAEACETTVEVPEDEWFVERDQKRMAQLLNQSAKAVRDAVKQKVESGQEMALYYDHPILMLQHLLWHEGYHHGQIKLALKLAGRPITDEVAGPISWRIWLNKTGKLSGSETSGQ